jgi:hypothetical protein
MIEVFLKGLLSRKVLMYLLLLIVFLSGLPAQTADRSHQIISAPIFGYLIDNAQLRHAKHARYIEEYLKRVRVVHSDTSTFTLYTEGRWLKLDSVGNNLARTSINFQSIGAPIVQVRGTVAGNLLEVTEIADISVQNIRRKDFLEKRF